MTANELNFVQGAPEAASDIIRSDTEAKSIGNCRCFRVKSVRAPAGHYIGGHSAHKDAGPSDIRPARAFLNP